MSPLWPWRLWRDINVCDFFIAARLGEEFARILVNGLFGVFGTAKFSLHCVVANCKDSKEGVVFVSSRFVLNKINNFQILLA
jgi:hypothetical protein